ERTGCLLLWGHNPSSTYLPQATAVAEVAARGAAVIVVDPRRAGAAARADQWLRVRPGTDGALALGLASVMLAEGRYDRDFVRDWTHRSLLVRADPGRLLAASELSPDGHPGHWVAWDRGAGRPVAYDPAAGRVVEGVGEPTPPGPVACPTRGGTVACVPAFEAYAALCRPYP